MADTPKRSLMAPIGGVAASLLAKGSKAPSSPGRAAPSTAVAQHDEPMDESSSSSSSSTGAGAGGMPASLGEIYMTADINAELARQWLLPRGLASPGLMQHTGPLTLHTFVINQGLQVSFCPYFFIVRDSRGEVTHVQLLESSLASGSPSGSSSGSSQTPAAAAAAAAATEAMMAAAAAAASTSAEPMEVSGSRAGGTPAKQQQGAYTVATKGYVLKGPKGVTATSLRDNLNASAATMARLLESEIPSGGAQRKESESASKVLHLLKEHFVPIAGYKYEVGAPSHRWINGVAGLDARYLVHIANEAYNIMKEEPTLLRLEPPVYVIGDLHGNVVDFSYFAKAFGLWTSAEFVPARFLFLGDYVDRGLHSIEALAFVLALKVRFPDKVFLLRGNHECAEINGDEDLYLSGSFKSQCKLTYGVRDGEELWRTFNRCFEMMPLAAVIGKRIFCVHAGIPRYLARNPDCDILETIASIPRPPNITDDLVFDLLWADPATIAEERLIGCDGFPAGFGRNSRGPATCVFGKEAVKLFCEKSGCSHMIRAHQSPKLGVDISKNATILTVFSSSHYCGGINRAASVLVHDTRLDIILSNPDISQDPELISSADDYISQNLGHFTDSLSLSLR